MEFFIFCKFLMLKCVFISDTNLLLYPKISFMYRDSVSNFNKCVAANTVLTAFFALFGFGNLVLFMTKLQCEKSVEILAVLSIKSVLTEF